jgi:hypothetical protein
VFSGSVNQKARTQGELDAENDASFREKWRTFRYFCERHYVDMVGVTGSIPVAPTIRSIT